MLEKCIDVIFFLSPSGTTGPIFHLQHLEKIASKGMSACKQRDRQPHHKRAVQVAYQDETFLVLSLSRFNLTNKLLYFWLDENIEHLSNGLSKMSNIYSKMVERRIPVLDSKLDFCVKLGFGERRITNTYYNSWFKGLLTS